MSDAYEGGVSGGVAAGMQASVVLWCDMGWFGRSNHPVHVCERERHHRGSHLCACGVRRGQNQWVTHKSFSGFALAKPRYESGMSCFCSTAMKSDPEHAAWHEQMPGL